MKAFFGFLIAFLLISLACASSSSTSNPTNPPAITSKPIATSLPTNSPFPISTQDPLDNLHATLTDVLGSSNRSVQRLVNLTFDPATSEISITFAANDNLSEDLIKRGIQMDIEDILKTVQLSHISIPYSSIFVIATFPLVDVYGNSTEANVVLATYERSELDKINWDNFITDNIYLIANQNSLYLHPALQP